MWQCEVYDDNRDSTEVNGIPLEDYDAVIFHAPTWNRWTTPLPSARSAHQRYIFWSNESPSHSYAAALESDTFNLTMTYRWDSDIVLPYGWFHPKDDEDALADEKINYAQGKTKLIAWFVSNCVAVSGRTDYVKRLQDFVSVDIYGKCGTLSCSPETSWWDNGCREMVTGTKNCEKDLLIYN